MLWTLRVQSYHESLWLALQNVDMAEEYFESAIVGCPGNLMEENKMKATNPVNGCAIAQVASRWILIAEAWVSPRVGHVRFVAP
jgi:hypothetical protein